MKKTFLVVGGGGREHALVRALSESPGVGEVLCTPGNASTQRIAKCRNFPSGDNADIVRLAVSNSVDLVIPGPEVPLAAGLVDDLAAAGIPAFGPPAASARLESSKGFAKDFMARNGVATADYVRCQTVDEAFAALDRFGFPVVVKADGLAAGKGVLICEDRSEAEAAVNSVMVARDFGSAGNQLVIEECLTGWETSVIGIVDGSTFMSFLPAKDHKRAGEGDAGPNTGGMGVIAPHPQVDKAVWNDIKGNIIDPTMAGLVAEGLEYAGFLFIGVMVTSSGAKTLEYNVRLGDPEAQALLPLLSGDLTDYMAAALKGRLKDVEPRWLGGAACCVVLASEGYPGFYETGYPISGISDAEAAGVRVYGAGVRSEGDDILTDGGRVLGVTGVAENLEDARDLAYHGIEKIHFKGAWYRTDIGKSPLKS
jgi:phosphoribosylamine--glycine ligase